MNRRSLILFTGAMILSHGAFAISYMTQEEALHWALPDAENIKIEKHELSKDRKIVVEEQIGWKLKENQFTFYAGYSAGKITGYAFIDEEIGRYQPITFVVALTPEGKVRDFEIMVYRETIGNQIKGRKFLSQFQGRDVSSPMRLGQDVDSITGATLSARAATRVVKKAVVLFQKFY